MSISPRRAEKSGPRVIVVGAGIVGLYAALELTLHGCTVTLLEADARSVQPRDRDMRAATLVAAGMLAPYAEALRAPSAHPGLMTLGARALRRWRDEHGAPCGDPADDFVRVAGALLLAETDGQAARLAAHKDMLERAGVIALMLDGAAAKARAPLAGVRAALAIADEAIADVRLGYAFFEDAFVRSGGSLLVGAEAREIETTGGKVCGVRYDGGRIEADAIVLACGAYAPASLARQAPALARVTPAAGQRLLFSYLNPPADFPNLHAEDCYIAKVSPRAVIVGATTRMGSADPALSPAETETLTACARRIAPSLLEGAQVSAAAGVRPMSLDGAPLIGPNGPEGCFIAAGHGRNGWLLANVTADIITDYVLGRPIDPLAASFKPDRFNT